MRELVIDAWAMVVPKKVSAPYAELHVSVLELDTPHGQANATHILPKSQSRARARPSSGRRSDGADLVAVAGVAREVGVSVALVEQPYRVAGRRPAPAWPARRA